MSWADKQLKAYREQKKVEERATKIKELALSELMKDENFGAILKEQYNYGYSEGFDEAVEQVKNQVRLAFICSVAVALKYERISERKTLAILGMVDEFTNQDKTSAEFAEWCRKEAGINFEVREK